MHSVEQIRKVDSEVVHDDSTFFPPVSSDMVSVLIGRYQSEREKIERISALMIGDEYRASVQYFLDGYASRDRHFGNVADMFELPGALASLNRTYWAEALALTDIYECMPQARRDFWNAQLKGEKFVSRSHSRDEPVPPLPEFEEDTVRGTITSLLQERSLYFAERVDGIFSGLSGDHVTNMPQGFGTRMILGYMLSYGSVSDRKAGLIHDLRSVIAKLTGRDAPKHTSSYFLCKTLESKTGEWVTVDGGSLRIRLYKKGTAHLEVHPDMAWQLNRVLASMHPMAIPAEFRVKPNKKAKEFAMAERPLPFATVEFLSGGLDRSRRAENATTYHLPYETKADKALRISACEVLAALGGSKSADGQSYEFDYPIYPVLTEVILSGCLPDQKSHQFYPTNAKLAEIAVDMADVCDTDECLEPSAGQGNLADFLPKNQTTCVELSALHCAVLKAKGYKTVQADFLRWAKSAPKFNVIVCNPPFSEGRAKLHAEAASGLVKPAGRLVAILPSTLRNNDFLGKGWEVSWSPIFTGEFAGTGVSVVIMKATRLA